MKTDYINLESVNSLRELFRVRAKHSPEDIAYHYFSKKTAEWNSISWQECDVQITIWANALRAENLSPGERVAILVKNSLEWIFFEQASFDCGLTVVPLYIEDRGENLAYIMQDAEVRCLIIGTSSHWNNIQPILDQLDTVKRIISVEQISPSTSDPRLIFLPEWLDQKADNGHSTPVDRHDLASIVYTSGTTGKPKGVMLSHENIMQNAWAGVHCVDIFPDDLFLSFLPLSHMLERTVGYYMPVMSGARVSFARSIAELAEDFITQNPSVLITVPRIYERVYLKINEALEHKSKIIRGLFEYALETGWQHFQYTQKQQGWNSRFLLLPFFDLLFFRKIRNKFGTRFRFAICGGAPLEFDVARMFISMGTILSQGYGLTEYSPVISWNRLDNNDPRSVGEPLPGVDIKIGDNQELLVKGKSIMQGYWKNEAATKEIIDEDGWLHTGDKVSLVNNKIYITGRIKDIIVLSTGEKISPVEIEQQIILDPLFENVIVIGEKKSFLSALVVLNQKICDQQAGKNQDLKKVLLEHIQGRMSNFPGYARIHNVAVSPEPWTIDNGLLTPTLKTRREFIIERNRDLIEEMYRGH